MMNLKQFGVFLFVIYITLGLEAQDDQVLMVVNQDSIKTSEFLRIYNKNLDLVKVESQKELDNYLELFVEYQLKLQEAKTLKLNESKSYQREFNNYKRQLTKSYLVESEVTDELVEEAYDRLQWEIKAAHILLRLDENESDTLATYTQLLEFRDQLKNEELKSLKNKLHDGKSTFVEDLGYFTAFKMVYDFENAAYSTEVGKVSMPFRTRFGYHIIKVFDRRPSRGTMTAAHIMIANEQKDSTIIPQERIQLIYNKLKEGESFDNLAKQFSDDKGSAKKGGELRPFKSGELNSPVFEDTVFNLKSDGDYSEPFETRFGWHIVKRIKVEPLPDFETAKIDLENRVKRDSRSKVINEHMVTQLRSRYQIFEDKGARPYFLSIFNNNYFERKWELPEGFPGEKLLFSINEKQFSYQDFANYLLGQQRNYYKLDLSFEVLYDKMYKSYFDANILKFREENLINENPEFAAVLSEYEDGLLLFELMEQEVWNKVSRDSVGLKAYYDRNAMNYRWEERVELLMASSSDRSKLEDIKYSMFKKEQLEELKTQQSQLQTDVIFTSGVFPKDSPQLPKGLKFKEGHMSVYKHNDLYHLIKVLKMLPAQDKTLEEARGEVSSDYQEAFEETWVNGLKLKYPVWIDETVFNEIKAN